MMLETARKGYWQPRDARLREVAALHADLVARFGASGTEFVNDNRALRGFIASRLTPEKHRAYDDALQSANQGDAVNTANATVLRSESAPRSNGTTKDDAKPQPSPSIRQAVERHSPRPGTAFVGVLVTALLALAALVWWLRRRHSGSSA